MRMKCVVNRRVFENGAVTGAVASLMVSFAKWHGETRKAKNDAYWRERGINTDRKLSASQLSKLRFRK